MPPKVKNETEEEPNNDGSSGTVSLNTALGIPLTNTSSTTSGSTDFVKKLFLMLEDNSYENVVKWTKSGESFVVVDTNEFTKEILPKHFKHSNFASFVRQLNKYDFHKVKQSNEEKQQNEYGDAAWEFKHPDFRRHDRESLETIKRKGPNQKRPNSEDTQGNLSKLEENIARLSRDYGKVQDDLKMMNQKYNNVIESIITMKNINDRYFRTINSLVSALVSNGVKLPPLDLPPLEMTHIQQSPNLQQPQSQILSQKQHPLQNLHTSTSSESSNQSLSGVHTQVPLQVPLPVTSQHLPQTIQQPTGPLRPGFHVLLVEDDGVCISLCTKFLEKFGCTVTVVSDGLTAISALETGRYDIVFMDIIMPNLDGATATSIVRGFDKLTPIVAMTGNIEGSDLVTYLQHGMSDILAKPFTKDDLYNMLEKHLSSRTPLSLSDGHIDKRQKV